MKYACFLFVVFLSGCSTFQAGGFFRSKVDASIARETQSHGLRLVQFLQVGDTENAVKTLRQKSFSMESDISKEDSLVLELSHLNSVDMDLDDALDALVSSYPEDKFSYIARGTYLDGKADRARGEKWINETSEAQINNMIAIQELAILDFKKAIDIDPSYYIPYYQLGVIYGMRKNDSEISEINLKRAVELKPESYWAWANYLGNLTPRWGGSYEAMENAIDRMKMYIPNNKNLSALQASIDYDKGNLAELNKQYDLAMVFYKKALEYGRYPGAVLGMGYIYLQDNNYVLGCPLIREAVDMRPYNRRYNVNLIYCIDRGY